MFKITTNLLKLKNSRLYKNLFSLSVSQFGNYIIPLLVMPFLTRSLGPDKFGLITFAQVLISYFTLVVNYGFDYTITRIVATNREKTTELSKIFWNVLYAKLILFLASTVILLFLLQIPRFGNTSLLILTTHLINIGFMLYPSWFFQGMQDLRIVAILSFLIKLLYAILVFVYIRGEEEYLLNNLFLSVSQIAISLIALYIALKKYKLTFTAFKRSMITEFLKGGRFFFFSTLVINMYTYTNTFLLGLLSTESETAYFNVVYRIIFAIQGLLLVPFNMAFFPYISTSFSKNEYEESNKRLMNACYMILIATFACGLVLFIVAPNIVIFLFGNEFQKSIQLLRFLAFIPVLMGMVNVFGYNGLMPLHKDKTFLMITIAGGSLSILLNILFIPTFKSYGVAAIWITSELLIGSLCFVFYRRAIKRNIEGKRAIKNYS